MKLRSQHAVDQLVDEVLSVSENTTVGEGVSLLLETLVGAGELEGPEEVVGLLEVGSDGPDLVDEVLHACDAVLSEGGRDDLVVSEGDSGAVDLTAASLVDETLDGGPGGVSVGDERLDHSDHVDSGALESDENTVVELAETEEVHDLLGLGGKLVDTVKGEWVRD
jgi:hypothetical protein